MNLQFETDSHNGRMFVRDADGCLVASLELRKDDRELAALFSAAPHLLAACKAILQHQNLNDNPQWDNPKVAGQYNEILELARAAIRKATEGQSHD